MYLEAINCYKKSIEIAKVVPDNLFMVETDAPYLSPEPFRQTINQSSNIQYVIKKLAEVKEKNFFDIEKLTRDNTKQLFKKMR